jgi:hypothetical protein
LELFQRTFPNSPLALEPRQASFLSAKLFNGNGGC